MSIGAGGVIDELWVALGIKPDATGFRAIRQQVDEAKESLLSVGGAVKAFVAGFAIKEIASIGSTFEQNQIQIAGFLSALGQSSDFNQGLKDAQGVIQQITKDAAILPGEAQEYIDVFKAGLPFVQAAMPGGSLNDITKFTNQLTAIGKTFGLDSGLIAREFDHMLSPGKGMASLRLPLFRQLLSFMPKMANGARVTAESFNAMSAPKRLELLQQTFEKLQPMLDASASSFDAMWGAAVSAVKQLTRVATVPLFKAFKKGLDQFNAALYKADGTLTDFGAAIRNTFLDALQDIGQVLGVLGKFVMWLANTRAGALVLKGMLAALGLMLVSSAWASAIGSLTKIIRLFTQWRAMLAGGVLVALGLLIEDLYQFYTGGESVTGLLVKKWGPALKLIEGLVGALGIAMLYTNPLGKAMLDVLGVGIGKVFAALGPLIGRVIGFGIAWAFANLPIVLTIAALALVGLAIYELWKHWDQIVAAMKRAWQGFVDLLKAAPHKVAVALGFASDDPNATKSDGGTQPGGVVLGGEPGFSDGAGPPSWTPPDSAAGAAGGSTVNNNVTNKQDIDIHIQSTDPKAAGKEAAREIVRTAQTGVKL